MDKPYVICHMLVSLDGKVTGDFLYHPLCEKATEEYYKINREYHADAFACGRITMERSFTNNYYPDLSKYAGITMERNDFVANHNSSFFAVAFDRKGRLGWKSSKIIDEDPGYGNAHIIEVLTHDVKDEYLAYLKDISVSYIFAGEKNLDIKLALDKLFNLFNIKTLLLEGGSIINGAFNKANVIDELSLVYVPLTATKEDKSLFYDGKIANYSLKEHNVTVDDVVILKYKVL